MKIENNTNPQYTALDKQPMTFNHNQKIQIQCEYIHQYMVNSDNENYMRNNFSTITDGSKSSNREAHSLNYIRNKMIFG